MHPFRFLVRRHPLIATLIVAAALVLRVLVPGGFMPVVDHGRIVVTICTGMADGARMTMAMPGMAHDDGAPIGGAMGKCAYADLAQALAGGADAVLLAAAIAFVMMLALTVALRLPPHAPTRLRPPLRAPPLPA